MESLFTTLSHAVESSAGLALGAAFLWGLLSLLLSPCHLASLPLIVGFVNGQGRITTRRALAISALFSAGILIAIGAVGAITASAGRMLGDLGRWGNYTVAAVFLIVGLHLLDAVRLPLPGPAQPGTKRNGLVAGFMLGLVFGIALGPCTFAFMAPVLAVVFKLAATNPAYSVLLVLFYGLGHCSVIVLAGTFTEVVQHYLNWNETSRGAALLRRVCGALVFAGGLYLLYTAHE